VVAAAALGKPRYGLQRTQQQKQQQHVWRQSSKTQHSSSRLLLHLQASWQQQQQQQQQQKTAAMCAFPECVTRGLRYHPASSRVPLQAAPLLLLLLLVKW
jgi:hypothetical protein